MSSPYEDWTRDEGGMINTLVLEILHPPVVYIPDEFMPELGLSPDNWPEAVHPRKEEFVRAVSYEVVADRLTQLGWSRAGTS